MHDKLAHAKREIKALQSKLDRIKAIEMPAGGSEDYQQGVADMAIAVHRAMEPNKRQRGMINEPPERT
jgi:hypothetical protein